MCRLTHLSVSRRVSLRRSVGHTYTCRRDTDVYLSDTTVINNCSPKVSSYTESPFFNKLKFHNKVYKCLSSFSLYVFTSTFISYLLLCCTIWLVLQGFSSTLTVVYQDTFLITHTKIINFIRYSIICSGVQSFLNGLEIM